MPLIDSPPLPAQLAGGVDIVTLVGTEEPEDGSGLGVVRAELTPPAGYVTVAGVAVNNVTFTLRQLRGGVPVQANVASVTLNAGTSLVAETALPLAVTNNVTLAQDDVLDLVMHQNGLGLAVGAGVFLTVDIG